MKTLTLLGRAGCWGAGAGLFLLTLALGAPLSFWLDRLHRPADVQMGVARGSLLHGQLDYLAGPGWQLDELSWQLTPSWPLQARATARVSGQRWQFDGQGWPWQWRSRIQPLMESGRQPAGVRPATAGFMWDGHWQGEILMTGEGLRCRAASGQVVSDSVQLREPLVTDFGQVRLKLVCGESTRLQLNTQGQGQQLQFTAELERRRSRLVGQVQPDSSLAEPVRLLGLDRKGDGQIRRGWRW